VTTRVRALLEGHPFLRGFPEEALDLVAETGDAVAFDPGVLLFREGSAADVAYLVLEGHVAIEVHAPGRGAVVVDTVPSGHVVGLSWAAPPFRYQFDARAVDAVTAVRLDAARLRAALAENPAFGFLFLDRLAAVILGRLQATRLRLLDLYGTDGGA
jgi:CRP/FNR family transcriptional regulator, cyclic AMP receptor protein